MRARPTLVLALMTVLGIASPARAEDMLQLEITIRDHRFEPAELTAPADTRFNIMVTNADDSAEEFESATMKVEKVVAGGRRTLVRVLPLPPGRYPFIGEYHQDTANGILVVPPR